MTTNQERILREETYKKLRETRVDMPDGTFTHEAAEFLADLYARVEAIESNYERSEEQDW